MKKKILKIAAFLLALALIIGLGVFANALVGNPISKLLATRTAEKYLEETYAGTDFYMEDLRFSFKTTDYYAHIKSPSSPDSHFSLYLDMAGRLTWDSYEDDVLSGNNTAQRLEQGYREMVDYVFDSPSFPFGGDIAYGTLEFSPREYIGDEYTPKNALVMEELELDKNYDLAVLGAKAGHLVLYVQEENATAERTAQILLELRQIMDRAQIPFYDIDLVLRPPKPLEGPWPETPRIDLQRFLYTDIYEEELVQRVEAADKATKAWYAQQDAKEKDH